MVAYRKSYFGHLFGMLDFGKYVYTFLVNLSLLMHLFYFRASLRYAGLQKILFWASGWDSGLRPTRIQIFGESQFDSASFLLGLLLKYVGLQKIQLWASVWDFGFQRTHLHVSVNLSFTVNMFC